MSMRTLSAWMAAASLCTGCGEVVPPVDPSLDPAVRAILEQSRADVVNHVGSAASWGLYGIALDAHDCRAEAAACYRRARTRAPAEVAWAYLLAGCVERDNPEAAVDLYRQAVEADGHAAEPRFRLAELLLARDEPRAALEAVGFSPEEPIHEAHRLALIALCRERLGDLGAACRAATDAARVAPLHRGVHELLARLLYRAGDHDAAERVLATCRGLAMDATSWPDTFRDRVRERRVDPHRIADLALSAPGIDREGAVKTLARLAERHPDDWTFTADLARCQIQSGDPEAAVVTTTRWLDRHPPTVEVLKLRGAARLLREDWSSAAADFAAATRLRPSDASAWSDLAFAQQQLDSPEAADSLRRAVALAPLAGDERVRLAELLLAAGDVEEARRSVADLESLIPEHPAIDRLHTAISRAGREGGARVRD